MHFTENRRYWFTYAEIRISFPDKRKTNPPEDDNILTRLVADIGRHKKNCTAELLVLASSGEKTMMIFREYEECSVAKMLRLATGSFMCAMKTRNIPLLTHKRIVCFEKEEQAREYYKNSMEKSEKMFRFFIPAN